MMPIKVLERICTEHNLDPIALRESAEVYSQPQDRKFWGLTDTQCDAIAVMHRRGDLQAVVNLAFMHYQSVNSTPKSPVF